MTFLEWPSTPHNSVAKRKVEFDPGVLLFCGIGFVLSLAAILFCWYNLPGAIGF